MHRLSPLFLIGCAFIGNAAHQDRIDALGGTDTPTDTDPPTDTDTDPPTDHPVGSAPVLGHATLRLRYNDLALFRGLQLLINVTDVDGDLAGGEVVIQGGQTIPWSEVIELEHDQYLVPIDLNLGDPCTQPAAQDLSIFVRDLAGMASGTQQVSAGWTYVHHDESGISSFDQCEPCGGTLTLDDLPAIVCGRKGSNHGFIDYYDGTLVTIPSNGQQVSGVANLDNIGGTISFGIGVGTDTIDYQVASDTNIGLVLTTDPQPTPASIEFWISSGNEFSSVDWTVFLDHKLPDPVPQ